MPGFERTLTGQPGGVEIAFTCEDVDYAFARAVAAGAEAVRNPVQMAWGQTVAYVRSIEGTYVGLCSPLPASPDTPRPAAPLPFR